MQPSILSDINICYNSVFIMNFVLLTIYDE